MSARVDSPKKGEYHPTMTTKEIRALFERAGFKVESYQHDAGYNLMVHGRINGKGYIYRSGLLWGDPTTPEERILVDLTIAGLIPEDDGSNPPTEG